MPAAWTAIAATAVALLMSVETTDTADLSIPIDTAVEDGFGAGSEAPLTTAATADLEGATCTVRAVRRDGAREVNVGNDLIVASGSDHVTLADVEREPNAITEGGPLTLGSAISVTLLMGGDERFGAGIDLEFDCAPGDVANPGTTDTGANSAVSPSSTSTPPDDDDPWVPVVVIVGAAVVLVATGLMIRRRRDHRPPERTDDERA